MAKLTKMGRANTKTVVDALKAAVKSVEEEFGVVCTFGGRRYSDEGFHCKMEVGLADSSALADQQKREFECYAQQFGLKPSDFGKVVMLYGSRRGQEPYEICGVAPRSSKYPILAKRKRDGKVYKWGAHTVRLAIEGKEVF